jgi:hypothetical protein
MRNRLGLLMWTGRASIAEIFDLLWTERAAGVGLLYGLSLLDEVGLRGRGLASVDKGARLIHGPRLRLWLSGLRRRLGL